MKIYEFLKVKKVKCIDVSGLCLSKDKEYQLLGVTDNSCIINDDDGYEMFSSIHRFEPVVDSGNINMDELVKHLTVGKNWKEIGCDHIVTITEIYSDFANSTMVAFESDCCLSSSPLEMFLKDFEPVLDNDMSKSDTKIDISENSVNAVNNVIPTFKVGDKVYKFGDADVKTILEVFKDGYMNLSNYSYSVNHESICHATQENYELLKKPYPHIEFELSPKEITGSDLTKGMFERGDFAVVCKCSDTSEINAIAMSPLRLIVGYSDGYFEENNGTYWKFAVPYDPKTRVPLRQDVLNDTN